MKYCFEINSQKTLTEGFLEIWADKVLEGKNEISIEFNRLTEINQFYDKLSLEEQDNIFDKFMRIYWLGVKTASSCPFVTLHIENDNDIKNFLYKNTRED